MSAYAVACVWVQDPSRSVWLNRRATGPGTRARPGNQPHVGILSPAAGKHDLGRWLREPLIGGAPDVVSTPSPPDRPPGLREAELPYQPVKTAARRCNEVMAELKGCLL